MSNAHKFIEYCTLIWVKLRNLQHACLVLVSDIHCVYITTLFLNSSVNRTSVSYWLTYTKLHVVKIRKTMFFSHFSKWPPFRHISWYIYNSSGSRHLIIGFIAMFSWSMNTYYKHTIFILYLSLVLVFHVSLLNYARVNKGLRQQHLKVCFPGSWWIINGLTGPKMEK